MVVPAQERPPRAPVHRSGGSDFTADDFPDEPELQCDIVMKGGITSGVVYPLLADPLGGKAWTALQSWDPDAGRGALLAFRQDDPRDRVRIALRGDIPDGTYVVRSAPDDAVVGEFSAEQLRAIPEVIGVPYGVAKAPAVRAALRSAVVTSLVTHSSLALALLDLA